MKNKAANKTVKKRPIRVPKVKPDVMALFLKALSELYPSDDSAPGVVLAYVPSRKQFYASAVRYEGNAGTGKKVLVSSYSDSPQSAFADVAKKWADGTVTVRTVRKFIRTADDFNDFDPWGDD